MRPAEHRVQLLAAASGEQREQEYAAHAASIPRSVETQPEESREPGERHAELTRAAHCAEAGVATALAAVATSYTQWNAALAAGTEPAWLAVLDHDLDNDGAADFTLTLRDSDDETSIANDPSIDNDLAVYVVSACTKYPDAPVRVAQLVRYRGGGSCYQSQLGGCGGHNNAN